MGGKTTTRSKNAYAKKTYDQVRVVVPKGKKDFYMKAAQEAGFESLNSYINYCVMKDIAQRKGPQRPEEVKKAEFIKALVPDIVIENVLCVCEQESLKEEIIGTFPQAEVECCCQLDLGRYAEGSFDVVILTKPDRYLEEPEWMLATIKNILNDTGAFLWVFDVGDDAEFSFNVVGSHVRKEVLADPVERAFRLMEKIDPEEVYKLVEADQHAYEPWGFVIGWKVPIEREEAFDVERERWHEQMQEYFDTQSMLYHIKNNH